MAIENHAAEPKDDRDDGTGEMIQKEGCEGGSSEHKNAKGVERGWSWSQ